MDTLQINDRSRTILEALPNGILIVDRKGKIVLCNSETERLFEYSRHELEGQEVELLVPLRFRLKHPIFRETFFVSPQTRAMGAGRDLFGLRKNGTEFPIEIGLNPLVTENETFVLAAIVDISERKAAEERFRMVVESAPNALVIVDETGKMTLVNSQAEKMFGYDREDLLGNPIELLVPTRFRDHHPEYRNSFFRDPKSRPMGAGRDLFGLKNDGSEFPVEIGLNPLIIEGKHHVLASVVDITARKEAEKAVRESEQMLRLLVDGTKDYGIYMLDPKGLIASWNSGAERITGFKAEEVLGRHVSIFYPEETRETYKADQELAVAVEKGRCEEEGLRIRKDGTCYWANVVFSALRNEKGELYGFSKVTRDITERKNIEAALQQLNLDLQQKNHEMEQFIYTVSHDLKSPLVTSMSFIQFIREDLQDNRTEDIIDSLNRLERANKRMGQLIDDLLRLSRVGRLELKPESIDTTALIQEIWRDLSERVKGVKGVNFQIDIQENMPLLWGDRSRITQLFENLLSNAIKYGVPEWGPKQEQKQEQEQNEEQEILPNSQNRRLAKIKVGYQIKNNEAFFYVQDNGPGISPEYHTRIFGLFERLALDKEGTGVGLAIVSRVVQLHGGKVWVESMPGHGATFWISFPLQLISQKKN